MIPCILVACGGDATTHPEPTDTAPTGETGVVLTHTGTPPGPDLHVTAEQDPGLSVTLAPTTLDVREGFDALVTWTTITTDAWGDPLAPTSAGALVLLEILETPDRVGARLARDDLGTDLVSVWKADVDGLASAHLSDLTAGSAHFDPAPFLVENSSKSWVLGLATDGERLDLRTAVVLIPVRGATASSIALTDTSAVFSWSSTGMGAPLVTSSRWDAWTVDWSGLAQDVLGKPLEDGVVDELTIVRYPQGIALAEHLDDLVSPGEASWVLDVGGFQDARLELALDAGGAPFPGFTTGRVWTVSGRCASCLTRFPVWVAEVEVR